VVPSPVSLARSGGREVTALHHLVWLLFKGLPWLWRRGRDLVPYAASIVWREWRSGKHRRDHRQGQRRSPTGSLTGRGPAPRAV